MSASTIAGPDRATARVDDCTVSYLRAGSGTPLLFLHGAGGISAWMPFMARLAERYDVIVPDHPGFGRSETPAWLDNIHDLAYFYLDFVRALGLRDVHLVGNSLGGWIACEVAVRSTASLRTLTLVSPAGLRLVGVRKLDTFLMPPDQIVRALYLDQAIPERILATPPSDEQADIALKNQYAVARLAWQPRFYDPHLAKWLHRIDVPTLVLWGDSDRVIPPPYAAEFARLIPGAKLETIARAGHLPHVEQADAFLGAVTPFLEGAAR